MQIASTKTQYKEERNAIVKVYDQSVLDTGAGRLVNKHGHR